MSVCHQIKEVLKKCLSASQKEHLRRMRDRLDRRICRWLSSRLLLVVGCQRSGTTLLHMLLTAHPRVVGKDESEARLDFPHAGELLRNSLKGMQTCFKLPSKTSEIADVADRFPAATILWITRNPLSVVSSMKSLKMKTGQNWLRVYGIDELRRHAKLFPEIDRLNLKEMEDARLGALIWLYKLLSKERFERARLKLFSIQYEELVERTRDVLEPIFQRIGLPWSESVMHHEKVHRNRVYFGDNVGSRKLDPSRKQPELQLDQAEIKLIESTIRELDGMREGAGYPSFSDH